MMKKPMYILGEKRRIRPATRSLRRRLMVVFIVMLAATYLFWATAAMNERTRFKQALLDISRIQHATRLFRADHGRCPDNLKELITPPGDNQYLVNYKDPWGKPYKLICPARRDPGGVEVISGGPDKSFTGNDTISSL
jgi:type II secretory pathway pseudopilin PulG